MNQYIAVDKKGKYVSCSFVEKNQKGNVVTNLGEFNKNFDGLRKIKGYKLLQNSKEIQDEIFEERIQSMLKTEESVLRFINKPTRRFQVDEVVNYIDQSHAFIERIFDDGLLYLVNYTTEKTFYGEIKKIENQRAVVPWMKILKHKGQTDKILSVRKLSKLRYSPQRLQSLIFYYYQTGIDMTPEYQRDYVWSDQDKIDLIDSIFNSIEIGKFALIFNTFEKTDETGFGMEILDGKQRINAIIEFYEDKFRYKGYFYSELSERDRLHFIDYSISIAETNEELTLKERYEYFIVINSKGKAMDPEHLKAVIEAYEKL